MLYQIQTKEDLDNLITYLSIGNNVKIINFTTNVVTLSDGDEVLITPDYLTQIQDFYSNNAPIAPNPEELHNQDIIYGKDKTSKIVSLGTGDSELYIWREEVPGQRTIEIRPLKRWIIGSTTPIGSFTELEGQLDFKYLQEYDNQEGFDKAKRSCYANKEDFFLLWDDREQAMVREGYTYFKDMKVEDISILSFDIESSGLNPEDDDALVFMISNTYRAGGRIIRRLFSCEEFESEGDMIEAWASWVVELDPSLLVGHNIVSFDLPYLNTRAQLNGLVGLEIGYKGEKITFNKKPSQIRVDGNQSYDYYKCNIFGREIVDTWVLAIKYDIGRDFPSYGLKPIVKHLGMEKEGRIKWDFEKNNPMDIWRAIQRGKNGELWDKFKAYCSDDSEDSVKLFDLMIPSLFYWAQSVPKTFQRIIEGATGAQIDSIMIRSYLQLNHSLPKTSEKLPYEGAISFGIPGIYKNVIGVDFASLYPSIIRSYKIYDKEKDPKAHILIITEYFTIERLKNKKLAKETQEKYYSDLEQSQKRCANSIYGFTGANGLLFNSPACASEITRRGRELFNKVLVWATGNDFDYWKTKTEKK